jgi:hypothetical protein
MFFIIFILVVCLLTLFLLYLLFAPLVAEINSNKKIVRFRIVPLVSIRWVTDTFPGYLELTLFGFRKKLSLSSGSEKKRLKGKNKPIRKIDFNQQKIIAVLKSFRIKKWIVNIDTGDMALNGLLFPTAYALSSITGKRFYINFCGISEVNITIQNNVFRMLKAYFL